MPIKTVSSKRKGAKSLAYFKGSLQEAKSLNPIQISSAFDKAGVAFENSAKKDEEARKIKESIQRVIKDPHDRAFYLGKQFHKSATLSQIIKNGERASGLIKVETKKGLLLLRIFKTKRGIIIVKPVPVIHGITGAHKSAFEDLMSILEKGFKGGSAFGDDYNVIWSEANRRIRKGFMFAKERKNVSLAGDSYSIEMFAPVEKSCVNFVSSAAPSQIISVDIQLSNSISKETRAERMRFYKEQIQTHFGVPVKFVD